MQDLRCSTTSTDRRRGHDWTTNLVHPDTNRKIAYTCPNCKIGRTLHEGRLEHYYVRRCKACTRIRYARDVANKIEKMIKPENQHCLITFTLPEKQVNMKEGLTKLKTGIKRLTRTANWNAMFDGWVYCYEEVVAKPTTWNGKIFWPKDWTIEEALNGTRIWEGSSVGEEHYRMFPTDYPIHHAHVHMIAKRTGRTARITPKQLEKLKADAVHNGLGKVVNVKPVKRRGAYRKKTTRYLSKYVAKRQGQKDKNGTRLWERGGTFRGK